MGFSKPSAPLYGDQQQLWVCIHSDGRSECDHRLWRLFCPIVTKINIGSIFHKPQIPQTVTSKWLLFFPESQIRKNINFICDLFLSQQQTLVRSHSRTLCWFWFHCCTAADVVFQARDVWCGGRLYGIHELNIWTESISFLNITLFMLLWFCYFWKVIKVLLIVQSLYYLW